MTLGTWVQMWRMATAPEDVGMRMRAVDGKIEFVVRASVGVKSSDIANGTVNVADLGLDIG